MQSLNILKDFKFPKKIINLIRASFNHTDIQVKIGNFTSQPMRITTGLRQGEWERWNNGMGQPNHVLFNLMLYCYIRVEYRKHIEHIGNFKLF